jgi:hypothetical protein
MVFVYSMYRRRTVAISPDRSPEARLELYSLGKRSPWAAKASERAAPDLTRSRTSMRAWRNATFLRRSTSAWRLVMMGSPAWIRDASS